MNFDDRGKRSNSLRLILDEVVRDASRNAETHSPVEYPYNVMNEQIKALHKLKAMGFVDQNHVDLVTAGIKSTYNSIARCQKGLPLEVGRVFVNGLKNGMLVIKP
jgi:hypothetical protein